MPCKHCGTDLRKTATGFICPSPRCQLIHDKNGEPLGWSIGAGNHVPGDILPYKDVISLWGQTGMGADGLTIMHVAAIVGITVELALKSYEAEIIAALVAQMKGR